MAAWQAWYPVLHDEAGASWQIKVYQVTAEQEECQCDFTNVKSNKSHEQHRYFESRCMGARGAGVVSVSRVESASSMAARGFVIARFGLRRLVPM